MFLYNFLYNFEKETKIKIIDFYNQEHTLFYGTILEVYTFDCLNDIRDNKEIKKVTIKNNRLIVYINNY